jgi:uncharacterized membrane protein
MSESVIDISGLAVPLVEIYGLLAVFSLLMSYIIVAGLRALFSGPQAAKLLDAEDAPELFTAEIECQLVKLSTLSYALMSLLFIMPFTAVVAVLLDYKQIKEAQGWIRTHYVWRINTFWSGLHIISLGALTIAVGFGIIFIVFLLVWWPYRVVRGWIALARRRALPV